MTTDAPIAEAAAAPGGQADPLAELLAGTYVDDETGATVAVATRSLAIEPSLAGSEAGLVAGLGLGPRLAVVSDPRTQAVLGARVEAALRGRFEVVPVRLPDRPSADEATVADVEGAIGGVDAVVAVGSGTINDLSKLASARAGKPYVVFGTAPSMNGYTSLTASITVGGHKSTLPAQAPLGAFFDLGVLAGAPVEMIRAGIGDSICRSTAQVDWLLSHLLLGTPYRELPFTLLREDERQLMEAAADLAAGSVAAMRVLARTLVLSGFGTALVGSSAPASQAEHLISHYIDMFAPAGRPTVLHGEQVGVTTLSVARLQEAMLAEPPVLRPDTGTEADFTARYGAAMAASVWPEFDGKRLDAARADALNHRISRDWSNIGERLAAALVPASRIEAVLMAAGAPRTPEAIHLERGFYETAMRRARDIRNRYTVLDLAAGSGRLDPLLPKL